MAKKKRKVLGVGDEEEDEHGITLPRTTTPSLLSATSLPSSSQSTLNLWAKQSSSSSTSKLKSTSSFSKPPSKPSYRPIMKPKQDDLQKYREKLRSTYDVGEAHMRLLEEMQKVRDGAHKHNMYITCT